MKRIKLTATILLIFLGSRLLPQAADYFANQPEWRQSSDCAVGLPCVEEQEYVYYIAGDSTVDGLEYVKLYKHGLLEQRWYDGPPVPPECDSSWTFNTFHTLLRQEGFKIYLRGWDGEDVLLYDFDLDVGDTLPVTANQWHEDIIVTGIDSLPVADGYRKVFNLSGQSSPQLIEGIGHEAGFLEPFPPILECGHFLNCYAQNGTTWYPAFGEACDLAVSVPKGRSQVSLTWYPNPVEDLLFIQGSMPGRVMKAVAYNTLGAGSGIPLAESHDNITVLGLAGLKPGIYLVQVLCDGNTTCTQRIIKK